MNQTEILESVRSFRITLREEEILNTLSLFRHELKFNPNHVPAGSSRGGQFTSRSGEALTEGEDFEARKKELGIPPAWADVRINKDKDGDLLATGKDAKGRTQYIYSENAPIQLTVQPFRQMCHHLFP